MNNFQLSFKFVKYCLILSLYFFPNISFAQGASGDLTGAAFIEHLHKTKSKIDTSGNLHKQSPKREDLDSVRGPDVLSFCGNYRMTYTDKDLCESLDLLSSAYTVNQFSMLSSKQSRNGMSNDEDCLDVTKQFFNQSKAYSKQQKDKYNVCRHFCETTYDSLGNRDFCGAGKCLRIVKANTEDVRIIKHCSDLLSDWVSKTTGKTQVMMHKAARLHNYDTPNPGYCINLWSSNGTFERYTGCCDNYIIMRNYFPEDTAKLDAICLVDDE